MQCRQCQFDNPPEMKFCGQCGTRLGAVCPRCGTEAPPGFKFCGECGAQLGLPPDASANAPPTESRTTAGPPTLRTETASSRGSALRQTAEGELKQVTVLCGELVCESAESLDPELVHGLLSRFFELAREQVARYGGSVNQLFDRGFTALFGAPVAYEDHARRAILAAHELHERVGSGTELGERQGVRWTTCMGLDSGTVVVDGIGDTAVGAASRRARRLQQRAVPEAILIGDEMASLVRPFVELEATAPLELDGGSTTDVWRVLSLRSELAPEVPDKVRGPFVGRTRELALLDELRGRAEQGEGQLVAISGEAGSGKSRLLDEHRKTLRGRPLSHLRGQCLSFGTGIPYLPFVDMIRKASHVAEFDDDATVAGKLRASLELTGSEPQAVLPYLLRLLGAREGTAELDGLEPQALQQRTFAAMRRMLLDAGRTSLVVVELEDVHWIDPTSAEFLASLVEVMGPARLLLLLTYRPGFQPSWLEKSYVTQVALRHLNEEESRKLLRAVGVADELGERILEKAEGNPLFLEELARSLTEDGTTAIPNTIQDILMARIDRLPEVQKQLLRVASVLGREISLDILAAIWDRPEPLEPVLEELRRAEFLYKVPAEDQSVHFFKHALTQEVAYESLLARRRRELHGRIARLLEELYADHLEDAYDRLTYHYPRAGEPEKTVHYLTLFADRAARDYAHAEAADALREALGHAEKLPPESYDRRLLEVVLKLAESLLPLARFPETLELCERHSERVERLDEPTLSAQFYFWLAHTHTYLGHQENTRRYTELAITAAQKCADESTEGKASYVLGRDGFWSGRFADGLHASLRAVVLLERSGEPWWQGQAYWVAGFNYYALGQFDQGIAALERACEIGVALDDYRLDASWSLGYFYASLGDWESGIECCRRGLARSRDPLNTAVAMGFLGYAQLRKGDISEAIVTLGDSVEKLRETGMQQILGWFSAFLSEAYLAAERLKEARELGQQALVVTQQANFLLGVGLARRALGRVSLGEGDPATAKSHLEEALGIFTSLEVPFEAARTRLDLVRWAHHSGKRELALATLRQAHRSFTELGAARYVERAGAMAERLGLCAPE